MTPAHPPLPTAWSFPFQVDVGSQTSALMSESFDGVSVASTRQKEGKLAYNRALPRPPPRGPGGGSNAPAATVCADVTCAFGNASAARSSQGVAARTSNVINNPTDVIAAATSAGRTTLINPPYLQSLVPASNF
jgi:hypothetical protein